MNSRRDETIIVDDKYDSVVRSVVKAFTQRAEIGQNKYGTNLDRSDLNLLDWIQHAQEEHMDGILYLEKIKKYINTVAQSNRSEEQIISDILSNKMNRNNDIEYAEDENICLHLYSNFSQYWNIFMGNDNDTQ